MRIRFAMGWLVGLLVLSGCGGAKKGTLSGKVTYKNQPVTWGRVVAVGVDDRPLFSMITPQGTYQIPDVPVGKVRIAVETPTADQIGDNDGAKAVAPPKKAEKLPAKYGDVNTSELSTEVKVGNTVYDVELK